MPVSSSTPTSTSTSHTIELAPKSPFSAAHVVYAQPNFTTSTLYPTGQNTLKNAGAITSDMHGGFYVADYGNNRVLHFPSAGKNRVGPQADRVYGQPDYGSNAVGHGATELNYPHGVAVDLAGGLYVADTFNNRVLHYPQGSTTPDRVYGQPTFDSKESNGVSPSTLAHPQGLVVDGTGLYVADTNNNRVLHYSSNSTTADFVYGQGTPGNSPSNLATNSSGTGVSGLNVPRDVAVNPTGLYISDSENHRVTHYNIGNPLADHVYGQPGFAPTLVQANQGNAHPTATTLNNPTGIALDQRGGLYIADRRNNRILYYAPIMQTTLNDPPATGIYGQSSYTSKDASTTDKTFNGPGGVSIDTNGNVFVLDIFNQRVLTFTELG
ncbi:MAG: hypothetical protein NVSMB49_19610 [Ktedonobacteraceae bacterium]